MVARRVGKTGQVGVKAYALLRRVNRRLALEKSPLVLRKNHPGGADGALRIAGLGAYYLVDLDRNRIADADVDLARFARKCGALQPHETLDPEDA